MSNNREIVVTRNIDNAVSEGAGAAGTLELDIGEKYPPPPPPLKKMLS